jgi:excisionase family DNA binding protein
MNAAAPVLTPIAVSITTAADLTGTYKETIHKAILAGELSAHQVGHRVIVLLADLEEWVRGLPTLR